MDIERLTARNKNGLAYLVNVKPNEQEVDSPHKNTLKCILDCFERLAQYEEEAIARQSVKSEEVQEAIEWIEEVLSNSKICRDGDFGVPVAKSRKYEAIRQLILSALQAYVQKKG